MRAFRFCFVAAVFPLLLGRQSSRIHEHLLDPRGDAGCSGSGCLAGAGRAGGGYGHAWLWLGDGEKAARTLYAFGNHSSPLLAWREEQMPVQKGDAVVGDMPHNWASAEFIRLVRHCLILERGSDLHLFEGMPAAWAKPGAITRVRDIATAFGPMSFEFRVAAVGTTANLKLTPPKRSQPDHILLHLDNWSGRKGTMTLRPESRNYSIGLGMK
jgi:hypothetical protein